MLDAEAASWITDNIESFDFYLDSTNFPEEKNPTNSLQALREAIGVVRLPERVKPNPVLNIMDDKFLTINGTGGAFRMVTMIDDEGGTYAVPTGKIAVLIYDSKEGDPNLHLNGIAKDSMGRQVWCRHLAKEVAARHMKGYAADLSTIENIGQQEQCKKGDGLETTTLAQMVMEDKATRQDVVNLHPDLWASAYYNLFPNKQLGAQLQFLASILAPGEVCTLELVFLAPKERTTHAMVFSIRHKQNGTYAIKFYDPNMTNKHRRALCKDLNSILLLNINNLWDDITHLALEKIGENSNFVLHSLKKANPFYILHLDSAITLEDLGFFSGKLGSQGEYGLRLFLSSLVVNQHLSLAKKRQVLLLTILDRISDSSGVGDLLSELTLAQVDLLFDKIVDNPNKPIKSLCNFVFLMISLSPAIRDYAFHKICPRMLPFIKTPSEFQGIQRFLVTELQKQVFFEAMDQQYQPIKPLVDTALTSYTKALSRFKPSIENPGWASKIADLSEAKTCVHLYAAVNAIHQSFLGQCTLLKALEKTGVIKALEDLGYKFQAFGNAKFFDCRQTRLEPVVSVNSQVLSC